jgi:site-specific recombinase XerD
VVLRVDPGLLTELVRARKPARVPVVLSPEEVRQVLGQMRGTPRLVTELLYGSGARLLEVLRLRVKDVDFARGRLVIRDPKGGRDRQTVLPDLLRERLQHHLEAVRETHRADLEAGFGAVELPGALGRKFPGTPRAWVWQWVFPATRRYVHPVDGERRHHLHETVVQRAFAAAVRTSGLSKRATCHTLRHSFATHLLTAGYDIRVVQHSWGTGTCGPQ